MAMFRDLALGIGIVLVMLMVGVAGEAIVASLRRR